MTPLLDKVMDVIVDNDLGPRPLTYDWLCDYIVDCWNDGLLADFTADDLATTSFRLKQLTPTAFDNMVLDYIERN